MELVMVAVTKRDFEPRNVLAATGMVLLDILGHTTNHAHRVLRRAGFHDRAPIGV